MRTTLTLDDDLAKRAGEPAQRPGLGEVASPEPEFDFLPHAGHLRPGINDRSFNELAWEAEAVKR
jgi:hypothetical protein